MELAIKAPQQRPRVLRRQVVAKALRVHHRYASLQRLHCRWQVAPVETVRMVCVCVREIGGRERRRKRDRGKRKRERKSPRERDRFRDRIESVCMYMYVCVGRTHWDVRVSRYSVVANSCDPLHPPMTHTVSMHPDSFSSPSMLFPTCLPPPPANESTPSLCRPPLCRPRARPM